MKKTRKYMFTMFNKIGMDHSRDYLTDQEHNKIVESIDFVNNLSHKITDNEILLIVHWLNNAKYETIEGYDSLLHGTLLDQVLPERKNLVKKIFLLNIKEEGLKALKTDMMLYGFLDGLEFNNIPVLEKNTVAKNTEAIKDFISNVKWDQLKPNEKEVLTYMIQYIKEFSYPTIISNDSILTDYQMDSLKDFDI